MADSSLLASIISGTNPLSPQMLEAYQGAQLSGAGLDPNFGHNEGPFGALGKIIAAARGGPMLQHGVQATTAGNMAAMPDLAKLLANPDPYSAINAETNPVAAARLLQGATPETAANARLLGSQAALAGLNVTGFQNTGAAPADSVRAPANKQIASPVVQSTTGVSTLRPTSDADVNALGAQLATMPDAAAQARIQQVKATNPKLYAKWLAKVKGANAAAKPGV